MMDRTGLKRWLPSILVALMALTLASGPAAAGDLDRFKGLEGTVDIAGGTAHVPVMKEAAKRIMTVNPKIRITIAGGGSGVGVQKVGEGLVNIGNTGRALTEAEVKKYGLKTFPFAIDGVAVAVNPKNKVGNLKAAQIQEIFAGKIANWKQVGGADAAIHLFTRDEASGTREVFWKKLLKKGSIAQNANVVASNGAMKVSIAQDPNAIGYLGIGHVDATVKAVELDGVHPTQENAKNGKYPIVRKLYMNTKGEPTGVVKAFIEYIVSPEGAEISKKSGYIPLK
jgi:phosphate transport system substrate-binding protein